MLAVRATARLAAALAVSFEATCAALDAAAPGRPCYLTGTPIRDTREVDREAARRRMDIPATERVLLVMKEAAEAGLSAAATLERVMATSHG